MEHFGLFQSGLSRISAFHDPFGPFLVITGWFGAFWVVSDRFGAIPAV